MNHGTQHGYRYYGCRCEPCTAAHRDVIRARKHRNRTRRDGNLDPFDFGYVIDDAFRDHVRALIDGGWNIKGLARHVGWNAVSLARVLNGGQKYVRDRAIAARILAEIPDEPIDPTYIDEVAVERFIQGYCDWRDLTPAERKAAAVEMDRRGMSRNEIQRRVRLNSQTVYRVLEEAGRPINRRQTA